MKYLVTGARGVQYECDGITEARNAAGKYGLIEPMGMRKNGVLTIDDSKSLLYALPLNVASIVHEVEVRRVGPDHFVVNGVRYSADAASKMVAKKGCGPTQNPRKKKQLTDKEYVESVVGCDLYDLNKGNYKYLSKPGDIFVWPKGKHYAIDIDGDTAYLIIGGRPIQVYLEEVFEKLDVYEDILIAPQNEVERPLTERELDQLGKANTYLMDFEMDGGAFQDKDLVPNMLKWGRKDATPTENRRVIRWAMSSGEGGIW